ncbi:MAG: amino acid ABC transporter permease [Pseudomonadota bacterium]
MFDLSFLVTETGIGDGSRYIDWLKQGLLWTLSVSFMSACIASSLGIFVGVVRTLPNAPLLRLLSRMYVELFRNIPLLLQLFLWFYVLPEVLPVRWGDWLKKDLNTLLSSTSLLAEFIFSSLALGCYSAARVAEQIRAGIQATAAGQIHAAKSLGLSQFQCYRFILIPQALRMVWPILTSELLSLFKNSSLAMTIGLLELTGQTRQISDYTFRTFEIFLISTLIYIAISFVITGGMRHFERRMQKL